MSRRLVTAVLGVLVALGGGLPAVARAQAPAPTTSSEPAPSSPSSAASAEAPAASSAPPPARPATGYGYSDPKPRKPVHAPGHVTVRSGARAAHHVEPNASGPVATLPGFQMMGDAGSRLFVELTQSVPIEERHARGVITYVLKGARVVRRNNENALVTLHFNTPVTRARLLPSGHDLLFIIDLRANVTPAWKLNPGKDGGSVLVIDFPKGSYVP
ncbi:MAG TPA: hypothetical protein VLM85_29760 [Polyangiaceae bacterium]|nr:hypothetical protein [Polyangiaceae bacterium]